MFSIEVSCLGSLLQTTIENEFSHVGTGVHLGRPVRITIKPANVGHGIVFKRTDVDHQRSIIPANFKYLVTGQLCTSLANSYGVKVMTVEHLLAAFSGVGVTNALIEIDNEEVPILDGSSDLFVKSILKAGVKEQDQALTICRVTDSIIVEEGPSWVRFEPADRLILSVTIDYPGTLIGRQNLSMHMLNGAFIKELSNCRTFCLNADVKKMVEKGLALGGSLKNAVVIDNFKVLNPGGLRKDDEFVRHKMLDALGDLALSGIPIFGHFTSFCGGHKLNTKLVEKLFSSDLLHEVCNLGQKEAFKLLGFRYKASSIDYQAVS